MHFITTDENGLFYPWHADSPKHAVEQHRDYLEINPVTVISMGKCVHEKAPENCFQVWQVW